MTACIISTSWPITFGIGATNYRENRDLTVIGSTTMKSICFFGSWSINYLGKSYPVKIKIIKTFTGLLQLLSAILQRFVPRTATTEFNFFYISGYWLGLDQEFIFYGNSP